MSTKNSYLACVECHSCYYQSHPNPHLLLRRILSTSQQALSQPAAPLSQHCTCFLCFMVMECWKKKKHQKKTYTISPGRLYARAFRKIRSNVSVNDSTARFQDTIFTWDSKEFRSVVRSMGVRTISLYPGAISSVTGTEKKLFVSSACTYVRARSAS